MLLTAELAPALLDRIAMQADGVPLFIEELTKAAWKARWIPPARCKARGAHDTAGFAASTPRSTALYAKQVAQIGAVLGREFSYELDRRHCRFTGAGESQGGSTSSFHQAWHTVVANLPRRSIGSSMHSSGRPRTPRCCGLTANGCTVALRMPFQLDPTLLQRSWLTTSPRRGGCRTLSATGCGQGSV